MLIKDIWGPCLLIFLLAGLTGFLINSFRSEGKISLADYNPNPRSEKLGGEVEKITDPDALEKLLSTPGSILLDARGPLLYDLGHIPGAINLPADELEQKLWPFISTVDNSALIITYCSESLCPLADRLAKALVDNGLKKVYVFSPGFDQWADLGRPIEKND
ncbi:MAG: rhodanese-like domain-containing protein [Deltaproteobacteria bacterium]|nr:rhodanese-like domain-containing protein [Deltaproteobacteria bacterium]